VHGSARELLWLLAVAVDVTGGLVGFYTPGLGRSSTADWTIEGNHFAERCQAFLLIALGESVVVIGATLASLRAVDGAEIIAFLAAFAAASALWWIYFDRSAEEAAQVIAASDDPGRLGRSAYHLLHPVMVAGIIVTAAADEKVLAHPAGTPDPAAALMILGGSALS
jgi:low temperature requirement protein LtrA